MNFITSKINLHGLSIDKLSKAIPPERLMAVLFMILTALVAYVAFRVYFMVKEKRNTRGIVSKKKRHWINRYSTIFGVVVFFILAMVAMKPYDHAGQVFIKGANWAQSKTTKKLNDMDKTGNYDGLQENGAENEKTGKQDLTK